MLSRAAVAIDAGGPAAQENAKLSVDLKRGAPIA